MDGWVVIGTDLDSKEFDKEMKRLQKESEKFAKEEERLLKSKSKLELDTSKTMNELNKVDSKIELLSNKMKAMEENNIPERLSSSEKYQKMNVEMNSLISKSQEYASKLELQKNHLTGINDKLKLNAENQDLVKAKIEETEAQSLGLHMNFDNIGKSITNNIKKVGRWVMAVFSIRSAYMAVRNAMSVISTYNDDLNNKLYSIKMMFATALEPIVTHIVNLVWKLMSYINYIAKAWFGVDLAAKSSANSMKAGAKSAKEMRKTLMGFDEANVLNDNGTTGTAGASSPKFEMPENVEIPSWVKWIAEHKDEVLGFLKTAGILIGALKLADFLGKLSGVGKILKNVNGLVGKIFTSLKGMSGLQIFALIAGVVITLTGIITTIKGVIAFIKDPSWENFNKILEGLTLTLLGVGTAMVALNASNPVGWVLIATGVVAGLVTGLSELARGLFENKANIKSVEQAQKDLTQAQKDAKEATENLNNAIDTYETSLKNAKEAEQKLKDAQKETGISIDGLLEKMEKEGLTYLDLDENQKKVYKSYMNNKEAQEKLQTATENVTEATKKQVDTANNLKDQNWELELSNANTSGSFDEFRDSVVKAMQDGSLEADKGRDLLERAMAGMSDASRETFMENIPDDIKKGLDPNRYQSDADKFAGWMGNLFNRIGETAKKALNTIKGWFSKGIEVPVRAEVSSNGLRVSQTHNAKGAIIYPKIQYHANGGIINQPGRGVPITQHIGGERGAEGIVPLTDSQQMDLLGQAIARHMTINLTNINQMNGRTISRELKRIEAQYDFATNG